LNEPLTPQDKAINHHIPLYFYHIHEVENEIYGHLVDWKPAWESEKGYEVVYHFNGNRAHYWIGTQDRSITRKQALDFAISVEMGKTRRLHVDLAIINDTGKRK